PISCGFALQNKADLAPLQPESTYHIGRCPSRAGIDLSRTALDNHRPPRGATTLPNTLKNLLVGKARDPTDPRVFHHVTLVAFLAWVAWEPTASPPPPTVPRKPSRPWVSTRTWPSLSP